MSRRTVIITVSCVLLGLGLLATVLAGLLRYQPGWYKRAVLPPGPERRQHSKSFLSAMSELLPSQDSDDWGGKLSDVQINSYLAEEGLPDLPDGISEPRVVFDTDRIRLAFRYGTGLFSTVVSIDLGVWLPAQERNAVVLEVQGFHAGALPISTRSMLEKISELCRSRRDAGTIGVAWYRDQETGHPVAVLRFQDDQPKPTVELIAVQPQPGSLSIHGRNTDPLSRAPGN